MILKANGMDLQTEGADVLSWIPLNLNKDNIKAQYKKTTAIFFLQI